LQFVDATPHIGQQLEFLALSTVYYEEIVGFCQHKRREYAPLRTNEYVYGQIMIGLPRIKRS